MSEVILKAIADLGDNTKSQIEAVKTDATGNVEAVKKELGESTTALKNEIKVVADEQDKLKAEFTEIKKKNGRIQVDGSPVIKSFDQALKEAMEAKTDDYNKFMRKERKSFDIELDMKAVGAVSVANVTGSANWGAIGRSGIIQNQNTMRHVRSLLNVSPAGPGTDYYFMKENGAGEGSIAPTSETTAAAAATTQATGLKPQFDVDLVEASVKFETIAGWMLMSKKAMNNIPGFLSFLQSRLPEKLWDVEDAQILYGSGTPPAIKGILTSGNFTASTSTAAVLVEKIIDDLSLLEDTYKRFATGIAMRPADYYSFFKNKADGSGEYDLPQGVSFVGGVLYILGVPVATTTALTQYDYVVGDFANGADLLIQDAMRIEFFEQDGTNVRTNQVTVRIEETIALPVYGSDYFIKGDSEPAGS